MKRISLALLMFIVTIGCARPQPAPSPNPVIGWTLTPGAGATANWTQTLYVAKVATLTTACPTPGGTAYTAVPSGAVPGTATAFSDSNETPGSIICAIDQDSFISGGITYYSGYSPSSAQFQVPALPTAPGVPTPTVTTAKNDLPRVTPHQPTVARNRMPTPGAPVLKILVASK